MFRTMLKSKIERAKVTVSQTGQTEALLLDRELMRRADLWPYERVEVYNLDNGARFSTFVAEADSRQPGTVGVCGAAAHLARPGHLLVITSQVLMQEGDLAGYSLKLVRLEA